MSQTIDKRVVEMGFENQQFEKGVGETIRSVDKLKNSLNFKDVEKGFANISSAAGRVSLGSIAQGVEALTGRFSALGIMAITTLARMTNAAIDAGMRIGRALTIDPIKAGLDEYETKLNSVQTILANTQKEGTNLATVTKALDNLNEYSDRTIYNFQEMARNIGTFTAAGVKLDASVAAIKGIANLAAISGSNSQQASTAMYQLSQALSTGTVRLMDWNSVVNAGMGGQVFQDAIMETARVHGVAVDQIIKEEGSFRDSLQRGWLSSEILTETLQKFTGDLNADQLKTMGYSETQIASIIKLGQTANDAATKVKTFSQLFGTLKEAAQSGWAKTWEIIIGDFEEAKAFLTDLNNYFGAVIGSAADARNQLLQGWKDLGGRTKLVEAFMNVLKGIESVIKPIKEAMREIFPAITAKQLYNLTEAVANFTKKLILSGENADKLKRIFKGVFAILDIGRMVVGELLKVIFGVSKGLGGPIDSITDFLALMADYIVAFREGFKVTEAFNKVVGFVATGFKKIRETVEKFLDGIKTGLGGFKGIKLDGLKSFMDALTIRFEPLGKLATLTGKFLKLIGALVAKVAPTVLKLGGIVADGVGGFIDKITGSLENFQPERVFDIINGGLLAGVLLAIRRFINKGSGMFDGVKDVLDGVKGSLEAWQASLKADVLLKIAAALGILTLSVIALSLIDSEKLTGALGAMTAMFVELGLSLGAYQKISTKINPLQMGVMAIGLLAIATSMLIMAGALATLSQFTGKELVSGIITMGALVAMIKIAAKSISTNASGMITGAVGLVVFSFAIRSLGEAVQELGKLDVGTLTKGLVAVGILVTELALFMRATDLNGLGILKAVGILAFAVAVNMLAFAVGQLAKIDSAGITQGLITLGLIFAEIAAFTAFTGGGATLILTAVGVGIIGAALLIFAEVLERIGNLSWEQIAKGLTSIAIALTLIGVAGYLIPPTLALQAVGILIMAEALVIIGKALEKMGGMTWEEIAKGLLAIGGSMLILSFALMAMQGSIMGAAALFIASAALLALAPALKMLGGMSWEEIARGLVALAGTFLVLGVAGSLLTPVIPSLLGLGAAMLLIGAGAALAGVGILALSAGLAALAVSGAAGAAALVVVLTSIVGLIPMLVKTLGRAILALIDVLVAGAPTLLKGIVTFLNILIDGLIEIVPKIVVFVINLIDTLLAALAEKLPTIVQSGYEIILAFLEGLRANIGDIVTVSYDIVTEFLNAVAEKLPEVISAGWNLIISYIDGLTASVEENLPRLMDATRDLGLAIIKGMVKGLTEGQEDAKQAVKDVAKMLVDGFKEFLGIHSPSTVFINLTKEVINGILKGIQNGITSVKTAMTQLAKDMVDALKGKYDSMVSAGKDLVTGLAKGIQGYIAQAVNAARSLATAVLTQIKTTLGIHSPSDETYEAGKFIDMGLALGVKDFSKKVIKEVNTMGTSALDELTSVLSGISDMVNSDVNLVPTITPVVDMSNVTQSFGQMQTQYSLPINATVSAQTASTIAARSVVDPFATTPQATEQQLAPVVSYVQNNYSPKELSRIEIYRQTKNQLAQLKKGW